MIKRLTAAAGAIALAAVCVTGAFGLAGCASSASLAAFEGTWSCDLEQAAQDAGAKAPASVEGMAITLTVGQDGAATIGALGIEQSGKLEAKTGTEATLEVEGATSDVTVDGDELRLEHGGATMTFEKQ